MRTTREPIGVLCSRAGLWACSTTDAELIFIGAIIDLRRDPTAIRRRLGLHEDAADILSGSIHRLFLPVSPLTTPPKSALPDRFNVAVPFIDRHLRRRARRPRSAIRTAAGDGHLRRAGRPREPLRATRCSALGLERGDRLLMVVKDCPAFFYLFWGAIKAGIVPVPLNTLLRAADYAYMIEDSRLRGSSSTRTEFAGEVEPALAAARPEPQCAHRSMGVPRAAMAKASPSSRRGSPPPRPTTASGSIRRARPAGPRARSMPARHGGDQRALRRAACSASPRTTSASRPPSCSSPTAWATRMTFPLWVGGTAVLARRARPTPDSDLREHRALPAHALLRRADALRGPARRRSRRPRPTSPALRVCVSAGEALPADIFRRWKEQTGTIILDGIGSTEALHIFISQPARRRPRRAPAASPCPATRRGSSTRAASRCARARAAGCGSRARSTADVLLEQAGEDRRDHASTAGSTPATPTARRRGLLPLLRPQRRHAEGRRHLVLADRDRGALIGHPAVLEVAVVGDADADRADQARGLRGAASRRGGSDGAADELMAPLQEPPRALQVSRAGSSSSPSCPRPRPARSSASGCGPDADHRCSERSFRLV